MKSNVWPTGVWPDVVWPNYVWAFPKENLISLLYTAGNLVLMMKILSNNYIAKKLESDLSIKQREEDNLHV
jgi:hypothetical protein